MDNTYSAAFPVMADYSSKGMTIAEGFAAHAPQEIPAWFQHSMEDDQFTVKQPHWNDIEGKKDQETVRAWMEDPIYDLPDHLLWFQQAMTNYMKQYEEWNKRNAVAKYFQWRKYYGIKMSEQF